MLMTGQAGDETAALTLKQAAHRLGVHYMTAYRYVKQGRLPAEQAGTAWRILACDLEAFASQTVDRSERPDRPPSTVDWPGRLRAPLRAGDERGAWTVVEAALAAGASPAYCCGGIIGRTAADIADDRARGQDGNGTTVADLHLAVALSCRLVALLGARFRRPGQTRGTVVVGAPVGDHHALPLAILATALRLEHFAVLDLGTDAPAEAFVQAALGATRCVAVGISITDIGAAGEAPEIRHRLHQSLPTLPVILGGRALGDATDEQGVVALVNELVANRPGNTLAGCSSDLRARRT